MKKELILKYEMLLKRNNIFKCAQIYREFDNDDIIKSFLNYLTNNYKESIYNSSSDITNRRIMTYYSFKNKYSMFAIGKTKIYFYLNYKFERKIIKKERSFLGLKYKQSIYKTENTSDFNSELEGYLNKGFKLDEQSNYIRISKNIFYVVFNNLLYEISENEYKDLEEKTLKSIKDLSIKELKEI